jgi:pimeloyl-ACP methyl ester carboxylesterase
MAEFVLVHGGLHGGWCFELLERELRGMGHRTLALDMPIDEPGKSVEDYADAVLAGMAGKVGDAAWVLGHSLGGFVIPRVALKRRVGGLLYLCAGLPARNEAEHHANVEAFRSADPPLYRWDEQERMTMSPETAVQRFYSDCTPELQAWAAAKLRPQWAGTFRDFVPIAGWPDVPVRAILTTEDAMLDCARYRALFQRRIGVTPAELPGGHSPFLSRPAALARLICEMTHQSGSPADATWNGLVSST